MAASLARRVLAVTFVYLYDEDMSYNPNCSFLLFFFLFSFLLGMAASLARRVLAVTFVYLYDEDRSYNPNVSFLFLFVVFC